MKNKKISACIFPETVPEDKILFPLVQVFHPLVYCRAVEEDEIPEELASPMRTQLEEAGLARVHVVSPLGEHRQRFLALIRDLATKKDDYAAQLKNLTLSGIGRGGRSKQESKHSIIGNLLQGGRISDQAREEREMLLWQARLVLKLGEIFDAEQLSLHREMERIARKEQGLFSELRREQSDPFLLTKNLQAGETRTDSLPKLRLKAWSRLFCLGSETPGDVSCFITANKDAADLLIEKYEGREGNQVQQLPAILLPAHAGKEAWQEQLQDLQDKGRESFAVLERIFSDPAPGPPEQMQNFCSDNGIWARLLEEIYPEVDCERCRLHLYRFARAESCELFMETFGRDEQQTRNLEQGASGFTLGWLELA